MTFEDKAVSLWTPGVTDGSKTYPKTYPKKRPALLAGTSDSNNVANNKDWFKTIIVSQRENQGCLPFRLGLSELEYAGLKHAYANADLVTEKFWNDQPVEDLRQELLDLRADEALDIRNLLLAHHHNQSVSGIWMAATVAAGCMGGNHLWRDLGLSNRDALSELLNSNFPTLASKNVNDMKWKKFFYKQLCEQTGSYLCRAPSCDQCATYSACFSPET